LFFNNFLLHKDFAKGLYTMKPALQDDMEDDLAAEEENKLINEVR
jgi:hypothetical protein